MNFFTKKLRHEIQKAKKDTIDLKFELKVKRLLYYFFFSPALFVLQKIKQIYDAIFATKQFRFFPIYLHLYLQL